jgi:hypothetical protein
MASEIGIIKLVLIVSSFNLANFSAVSQIK